MRWFDGEDDGEIRRIMTVYTNPHLNHVSETSLFEIFKLLECLFSLCYYISDTSDLLYVWPHIRAEIPPYRKSQILIEVFVDGT